MSAGSEKRLVGLKESLDSFEILAGSEDILAGSGQVFKSVKVGGERERMELALNIYCSLVITLEDMAWSHLSSILCHKLCSTHVVSPAWKGETLYAVEGTNQKLY